MTQARNLGKALLQVMDTRPTQICLQVKQGGRYQDISYQRFQDQTFRLVRFFHEQGLSGGERVVITADNSLEWLVAYMACLLAGAIVVPVRTTLTINELHFILEETAAAAAVLQESKHLQAADLALQPKSKNPLPHLKTILSTDNQANLPAQVTPMASILNQPPVTPEAINTFRAQVDAIAPQAPVAIQYVISPSDFPKGAVFTHAQNLASLQSIAQWLTFEEDDLAFTFRPWSEPSSLMTTLHYFLSGVPNALRTSYKKLQEDMRQSGPTITFNNPFGLEMFYDACLSKIADQPRILKKCFSGLWLKPKNTG